MRVCALGGVSRASVLPRACPASFDALCSMHSHLVFPWGRRPAGPRSQESAPALRTQCLGGEGGPGVAVFQPRKFLPLWVGVPPPCEPVSILLWEQRLRLGDSEPGSSGQHQTATASASKSAAKRFTGPLRSTSQGEGPKTATDPPWSVIPNEKEPLI